MLKKSPHPRDSVLAAALNGARAIRSGGPCVFIAFRNESGEMYRHAVLEGPAQLRYLRQRLLQLELIAHIADEEGVLAVLGTQDAGPDPAWPSALCPAQSRIEPKH